MAAMAASVADTTMKKVSETKCFSGLVVKYQHDSTSTKTPMTFTVYLPPAALAGTKVHDKNENLPNQRTAWGGFRVPIQI